VQLDNGLCIVLEILQHHSSDGSSTPGHHQVQLTSEKDEEKRQHLLSSASASSHGHCHSYRSCPTVDTGCHRLSAAAAADWNVSHCDITRVG